VPVLGYEENWHVQLKSLRTELKDIIKQHPEAEGAAEKVHNLTVWPGARPKTGEKVRHGQILSAVRRPTR